MSDHDDGSPVPRHRKPGRARKLGSAPPGRHLSAVPDQKAGTSGCDCPPGFHEYGAHAPGHGPLDQEADSTPGAYPVEDFASMSSSAAAMLLHRATAESESAVAKFPHIVITHDLDTESVSYSGPFATGLEALTVAHRFVEQNRAVNPQWEFTLTVAPLPPL